MRLSVAKDRGGWRGKTKIKYYLLKCSLSERRVKMRHAIQVMAMLGDVFLFLAAGYLILKIPFSPIVWIIIVLAFMAWRDNGGFIAWQPFFIRMFMKNAKKIGL